MEVALSCRATSSSQHQGEAGHEPRDRMQHQPRWDRSDKASGERPRLRRGRPAPHSCTHPAGTGPARRAERGARRTRHRGRTAFGCSAASFALNTSGSLELCLGHRGQEVWGSWAARSRSRGPSPSRPPEAPPQARGAGWGRPLPPAATGEALRRPAGREMGRHPERQVQGYRLCALPGPREHHPRSRPALRRVLDCCRSAAPRLPCGGPRAREDSLSRAAGRNIGN